jgi:hypothetical protein
VLMVGLACGHLVRLPTMSNGPCRYSTISEKMGCGSTRVFFPYSNEEAVELRAKKAS